MDDRQMAAAIVRGILAMMANGIQDISQQCESVLPTTSSRLERVFHSLEDIVEDLGDIAFKDEDEDEADA